MDGKTLYNSRIVVTGGTEKTKITKYRTGTTTVLQGAQFGLYNSSKTLLETLTTGSDGKVDFAASGRLVANSTYYFKETKAPAGYTIKDSNYKKITVDANGNVTFEGGQKIYNDRIIVAGGTEKTKITKCRTNTKLALSGAQFGLYNSNKTLLETITTGSDGKVDFAKSGKLEAGTTYYFKETVAPAGYIIKDSNYKKITVDNSGNVTFEGGQIIYNDKIIAKSGTDKTKITKYRTGTTTPLAGAEFGFYDSNKNLIETLTTRADGKVDFGASGKLEAGTTYYFRETKAPAGYKIKDSNYKTITVDNNGNVTFQGGQIVYNDKIIVSSGTEKSKITKYRTSTTQALSGAQFGLYNSSKTLITTFTTGSDGKVDFAVGNKLEAGETYYYKENVAPAGYKIKDSNYKTITVDNNGNVTFQGGQIVYNDKRIVASGTDKTQITKYRIGSTVALKGAQFGLYDANKNLIETFTTNANGKIDFASTGKLEAGTTYYFKETKAPVGYKIKDSSYKRITVDNNENVNFPDGKIIYNDRIEAQITKYRTGTNRSVPGAKFGLYDSNKNLLATVISESNGIVDFGLTEKLETGKTYYYKEIEAPLCYLIDDSSYKTITIDANGNANFPSGKNVYNTRIIVGRGTAYIYKYRTNTKTGLAGAQIGLYDANKTLLGTYTTDANGAIDLGATEKLEAGTTYYFKEITPPTSYKITDNSYKKIEVNDTGKVSFPNGNELYNDRIVAKITKYRTNTTTVLSGAKFGLYDANKNLLTTLQTNVNGELDFADSNYLAVGKTYYFRETEAPVGYRIKDSSYKRITIDANGNVTFEGGQKIYNDKIIATSGTEATKIVKYRTNTTTALQGAKFGLYDSSKRLLETLITGTDGKVDFAASGKLEAGETYYFKELQPATGYRIANDSYKKITVNNDGTVIFNDGKIIYNDLIMAAKGTAVVYKYKTGTSIALEGAVIGLCDQNGNILKTTANKNIELTTDSNGKVDFTSIVDLTPGTYRYKEVTPPAGYVLNNTIYTFTVDSSGNLTFGQDNKIYNSKIIVTAGTESTKITKCKTGSNIVVEGAEFGLYNSSKTLITTFTTGADGKIDFAVGNKLEAGETYYYKEIEAPPGYIISDSGYNKITVDNNGNVTFENGQIVYNARVIAARGTGIVYKYKTGTEIPISGAVIGLCQENGTLLKTEDDHDIVLTTDSEGKIDFTSIVDLEPGTYYYKEVTPPAAYVLNNTIYKFVVENSGAVRFYTQIIESNGTIRINSNDTRGIVYNSKIIVSGGTDATKVTKYRTGTTTVLPGAKIGLYNKDKSLLDEFITGDDGKVDLASTGKLEAGETYYYKEIEAPPGYIIDDSNYKEIDVDNNGTVVFINGKNLYNTRVTAASGTGAIYKYRSGTQNPLSGAIIGLCDVDGNILKTSSNQDMVLTTGNDGKVDFTTITGLEPGRYYYKEVTPPAAYVLNNGIYTFTVDNNGVVSFSENEYVNVIFNSKIIVGSGTSATKVIKYRTGTTLALAGAKIGLYDENQDLLEVFITGEDGIADLASTEKLEAGETYYYKEIEAPPGYIIDNPNYKKIDVDNTGTVTFVNGSILYDSKILATSGTDATKVIKYRTGTQIVLAGAKIGLYSKNKDLLDEFITGSDGKVDLASTGKLEAGETYYYKEIEAPPGYIIDDSNYKEINVDYVGTVEFKNGNVLYNSKRIVAGGSEGSRVVKYRTNTTTPLSGAKVGLYDSEKNLLDEFITGENGKADLASTGKMEAGETYYYKEIEAPPGYIIDDPEFKEITVSYEGTVNFKNGKLIYDSKIITGSGTDATKVIKYRKGTQITLAGAKVGLYDSNQNLLDEFITGDDGTADLASTGKIEAGETYYYKEIEAPPGYIIDDPEFKEIDVDYEGIVEFKDGNIIQNSKIIAGSGTDATKIIKYRTGTQTVLAGAKIGLYDSEKNLLDEFTTGEDGTVDLASTEKLEAGETYYYKEIEAPPGYIIDDPEFKEIEVTYEGTVNFKAGKIIYDSKIIAGSGTDATRVIKYRKGTQITLAGAKIGLYDSDQNLLDEFITGEDGTADLTSTGKIEAGETYYYKEIEAPPGYIIDDPEFKEIETGYDGTVNFKDGNILYDTIIIAGSGTDATKVIKYKKGTQIVLAGAKIGLYDSEKNLLDEFTTGEDGTVDLASTEKLEAGETYYYKEIEAPLGYDIDDPEFKEIDVDYEGIVQFKDGNTLYDSRTTIGSGDVAKVIKYKKGTQIVLAGAKIGLYDANKNLLDEFITGDDGTADLASTGKMETGETYYYKEIEAPPGYIIDDPEFKEIETGYDGTVNFKDGNILYDTSIIAKSGSVVMYKYIKGTTTPLSGAVIGLCDENGNILKTTDNQDITLVTDNEGKVDFTTITDIEAGTYKFKEITPPAGYELDNNTYTFTVDNNGDAIFTENINGNIIYNKKIVVSGGTGSAKVIKYKKRTQIPLAGARIGLYDGNKNLLDTFITEEDGTADLALTGRLEAGRNYYYKEIEAPEGYMIDDPSYRRIIVDDTGIVNFPDGNILYDSRVTAGKGTVVVYKYIEGTQTPLAGAVIGLCDENGEVQKTKDNQDIVLTTGTDGKVDFTTIVDFEPGTYRFKEITPPEGYALNNNIYIFTVDNSGVANFDLNMDKNIIYNRLIGSAGTTKLPVVYKYSLEKVPLSDTVIGICDENGNVLKNEENEEIILATDKNGKVDFSSVIELQAGETYYYREVQAPPGFNLDDARCKRIIMDSTGNAIFPDGQILYNSKIMAEKGTVVIYKYVAGTTIPLAGAKIGLCDENGNVLKTEDGNEIVLITNKEGKVDFTTIANLLPGTYKYKEIEAPKGYILDNTIYTFIVDSEGKVDFPDGQVIYNDRVIAKLSTAVIYKYIEGTTTPLAGAVIGLYDENGNILRTIGDKKAILTTDSEGKIDFANIIDLVPGKYYYKEITAPMGYVLNTDIYSFTVEGDGSVSFNENANGNIIYNKKSGSLIAGEGTTDIIKQDNELPNTGINYVGIIIIGAFTLLGITSFVKYKKA